MEEAYQSNVTPCSSLLKNRPTTSQQSQACQTTSKHTAASQEEQNQLVSQNHQIHLTQDMMQQN